LNSAAAIRPGPAHLAALLGLLLVGLFLAGEQLMTVWTVYGPSMEPTLLAGDRVIVDTWSYRRRAPRVGEIALFRAPDPSAPALVKRVATRPKSATAVGSTSAWSHCANGGGTTWLEGDNLKNSADSRSFGAVPDNCIVGRVVLRYSPLRRLGRPR